MTVLGLDIGGTKIAAAAVSADGALLRVARRPTPAANVWQACVEVLREVAQGGSVEDGSVSAVGIGSAGPIDLRANTVSPLNVPSWRGFPVVAAVGGLFPGARIVLDGDGQCIALAEQRYGAGRGTPNLLGVIVSTGVGGGLILGGTVVGGRTGNAGHIGHVVVEPGGPACACGGVGCLEAVASGPSAVRWAQARGWEGADGVALGAGAEMSSSTCLCCVATPNLVAPVLTSDGCRTTKADGTRDLEEHRVPRRGQREEQFAWMSVPGRVRHRQQRPSSSSSWSGR